MPYEIIDIPEQYQFITEVPEFKQDLPDNVYLDKVSTGCGATADWFVEELEQTKIAIETDPRFETIVEYVSIFGADPSLVEGCSARLGMSYLSKRIDKHKQKLRLQEVLRYKYNEGDILTNKVLKEDLAHLYQVLDLKGKPKLSDINLAFETSATKYKGKNAFRLGAVK